MDRRSPLTSVRRYGRLSALALAAVAVAGCSSSGGGSTTAASAPPSTASSTPGSPAASSPAPATTKPATTAPPAPVPTATTAPTTAGNRPEDACTLLDSPQVIGIVGTGGPFTGTHFSPKDGKPVWGCTWGSRQSYADIREIDPALFTSLRTDPEFTAARVPSNGQDAYLLRRKDGTRPEVNFLAADGRAYSVEVVKDRGPGDDVNAEAEAGAATELALLLSKKI